MRNCTPTAVFIFPIKWSVCWRYMPSGVPQYASVTHFYKSRIQYTAKQIKWECTITANGYLNFIIWFMKTIVF